MVSHKLELPQRLQGVSNVDSFATTTKAIFKSGDLT